MSQQQTSAPGTGRHTGPPAHLSGTITLGDLRVHRLGYGAIRLTGPGTWGDPADRAGAIAVLRRAVDLGVDFIDTAEAYGPYTNEELIRDALHPYTGIVVATKGGGVRPGPDQWEAVGRPGFIRQGVEMSLRRLGVDCLDLYQLHRIDPHVPLADTLGALRDLQQAGKIRHIGLSEADIDDIHAARQILDIVSVQNHYNLATRHWEHVVDYCQDEGIAFIPWGPLGSGDLSCLGSFAHVDGLADRPPAQIALAWLLRRCPLMLPIPGTATLSRVEENAHAAGLRLSDDQYEQLNTLAGPSPASAH
ncbi:aldo/keto reductase [Spongiactinospora sp. 9N601]|uniref:aldo/keto reductase n=1 Tax=Spongiactinospora sp. 9N601 TaxID=3375149 RepID=UPI0037A76EA5